VAEDKKIEQGLTAIFSRIVSCQSKKCIIVADIKQQ
jgi:hypothetical protein